jgi:hypothetical protein
MQFAENTNGWKTVIIMPIGILSGRLLLGPVTSDSAFICKCQIATAHANRSTASHRAQRRKVATATLWNHCMRRRAFSGGQNCV